MKKLFYLLFLLPFSLLMACNDDNDLPKVDLNLTLSGVTVYDNNFYTVAGQDVTIEDLTATSLNDKTSGVSNVIFYFEGFPLIGQPGEPFDGTFSTTDLVPGTYKLEATGYVLQVGSPLTNFAVSYPLVIVENEEDLPSGAPEIGSHTLSISMNP